MSVVAPASLEAPSSGLVPDRVEDLTAGLLLFFERPSPLQSWGEVFGHEWRHVGITVRTPEGLRVAGYGAKSCFRLDAPADLMGRYTRVGVAQVFSTEDEADAAGEFCRSFEHFERSDSPYTLSSVIFGPLQVVARTRPCGLIRSLLFAILWLYCAVQRSRYDEDTGYCCSTFVWAAVNAGRGRPLRLPLTAHPDDEAAYASPSTPFDEQLARWTCGPTDVWQAISSTNRGLLDLREFATRSDDVSEIREPITIDLRDGHVASTHESSLAPVASPIG